MTATKSNKSLVLILIALAVALMITPLIIDKGAEYGGSDGAGSDMVSTIVEDHEPWFTPVMETYLGGEISGEIESLLFCVQTGIGVSIIAFLMGGFVERKKWLDKEEAQK